MRLQWKGRNYRPAAKYIKVYKPSINELIKPLSEKGKLGSAILTGEIISGIGDAYAPEPTSPVVTPSVTPTITLTPTASSLPVTPTPSATPVTPADCIWNTTDELWENNSNNWESCQDVIPTPTPSVSPTNTLTPTATVTNTPSPTITPTASITPSITPTISLTPSITPSITPSSTPPALVNYKFTYIAASDLVTSDSSTKSVSNLNFTFLGNTFSRSGVTFVSYTTTNSANFSPTGVTGTGTFVINRSICKSGTGSPLLNRYSVQIKKNNVEVWNTSNNLADPAITTCSTQLTHSATSTSLTVSAGDSIEVIFTDVMCTSGFCY